MQKHRVRCLSICLMMLMSVLFIFPFTLYVSAEEEDVPYTLFQAGEQYDCNSSTQVNSMLYGRPTMGKFSVSGDISDISTYNGHTAYGLQSGQLSFNYLCSAALTDKNLDYHIKTDTTSVVDNQNLGASVGEGAIIIEKSYDGKKWEGVEVLVDFFGGNSKGKKAIYTTSGDDISKGCHYRFTLAYAIETIVKNTVSSFSFNEIADFLKTAYHQLDFKNLSDITNKPVISRHVERYEFYACRNDGNFSLHNLALENTTIPDQDGLAVDIKRRGETLEDGAVTTKGFQLDLLEADYECTINGRKVSDGATIKANGKYTVTVKTKLGMEFSKNVYVFQDKNQGRLSYFNDSVVCGQRVQDDGEYPSYAYGSELLIKDYSWQTPSLSGRVKNKTTGVTFEISERASRGYHRILDVGEYEADFYCGKTTSGNRAHYKFRFNIIDRDAKPYVNKMLLDTRLETKDYIPKHYEVAYQTTRGGYIYVCFAEEEDAYNYAYEIEKRFIEPHEGGLYYKEHGKPLNKTLYPIESAKDRIKLTQEIVYNAKQNVKPAYFDPTELYTYRTYSGDQDVLKDLEGSSIKDSIHVFPNTAEREKLIDRVPYLNGFRFVQAADYDVTEVTAFCQINHESYPLQFGWKAEDLLDVSSMYTITEKNKYGKTNTYDVCLMTSNQTVTKWKYENNGNLTDITLSAENLESTDPLLKADSFQLISAENQYDKNALIKITTPDNQSLICYCSEMEGIILYEKGVYRIELIDRVGNTLAWNVEITGNISQIDKTKNGTKTFGDISDVVTKPHLHRTEDE